MIPSRVCDVLLLRQLGCGQHLKSKIKGEPITSQATRSLWLLGRRYAAPVLSTLSAGKHMWPSGSILLKEYVSNETFNNFCINSGGYEGAKRLDPPNADQIKYDFWCCNCDLSTQLVKVRDRDLHISLAVTDGEEAKLKEWIASTKTYLEIVITGKNYTEEDIHNFYLVSLKVLERWNSLLIDLNEEILFLDDLQKKLSLSGFYEDNSKASR